MKTDTFVAKDAIKFGWQKTKEHFWFLLLVMAGSTVISGILKSMSHGNGDMGFAGVISFLFQVVVSVGTIAIALKIVRGKEFGFSDFRVSFEVFWKYIVTSILLGLLVGAGMILLIIPGIYFAIRYGLATYLVVDKHLGPLEAMKRSALITGGNKWKLFEFLLIVIGVNILGALALLVGLVVSIPTTFIAGVWVYNELLKKSEMDGGESAPVSVPVELATSPIATAV